MDPLGFGDSFVPPTTSSTTVTVENPFEYEPLHQQIRLGRSEDVEKYLAVNPLLASVSIPLSIVSKNVITAVQTPLNLAVQQAKTEVVSALANNKAVDVDVYFPARTSSLAPVYQAAINGNYKAVEILIDNGVNLVSSTAQYPNLLFALVAGCASNAPDVAPFRSALDKVIAVQPINVDVVNHEQLTLVQYAEAKLSTQGDALDALKAAVGTITATSSTSPSPVSLPASSKLSNDQLVALHTAIESRIFDVPLFKSVADKSNTSQAGENIFEKIASIDQYIQASYQYLSFASQDMEATAPVVPTAVVNTKAVSSVDAKTLVASDIVRQGAVEKQGLIIESSTYDATNVHFRAHAILAVQHTALLSLSQHLLAYTGVDFFGGVDASVVKASKAYASWYKRSQYTDDLALVYQLAQENIVPQVTWLYSRDNTLNTQDFTQLVANTVLPAASVANNPETAKADFQHFVNFVLKNLSTRADELNSYKKSFPSLNASALISLAQQLPKDTPFVTPEHTELRSVGADATDVLSVWFQHELKTTGSSSDIKDIIHFITVLRVLPLLAGTPRTPDTTPSEKEQFTRPSPENIGLVCEYMSRIARFVLNRRLGYPNSEHADTPSRKALSHFISKIDATNGTIKQFAQLRVDDLAHRDTFNLYTFVNVPLIAWAAASYDPQYVEAIALLSGEVDNDYISAHGVTKANEYFHVVHTFAMYCPFVAPWENLADEAVQAPICEVAKLLAFYNAIYKNAPTRKSKFGIESNAHYTPNTYASLVYGLNRSQKNPQNPDGTPVRIGYNLETGRLYTIVKVFAWLADIPIHPAPIIPNFKPADKN